MSDFVLGGIIGGGFTLLVSIITLIIQSYFSNKNTKLQMEFQKNERQEVRLIEFRSKYLMPLRECINSCCKFANELQNEIIAFEAEFPKGSVVYGNVDNFTKYTEILENLGKKKDIIEQELKNIEIYRSQVSDDKLVKLIFDVSIIFYRFSKEHAVKMAGYYQEAQNNLESTKNETGNKDNSSKEAYFDTKLLLSGNRTFISKIENINLRIEELLSSTN